MINTELQVFQSYLKTNRWKLLFFNALLLLIWGPWLYNSAPRIDTEVLINTPYTPFNWLDIGRQGGILTEYVFGLRWFNPYFSTAGGYLLICIAGTLMGYLFWRISRKSSVLCAAFGLLCFTAPIMTEQFYFDMQIFKVAWAYVLCAVAAGATIAGILWKRKTLLSLAVLCMVWCFSTYQIFVVLYIVLVITCFILLYQRWTVEQRENKPVYAAVIGGSIATFVAAFVINSVITKLFFSSGDDYLTGQIAWLSQPTSQCVKNILAHIKMGFLGNSTFYTLFYGVFAVLAVLTISVTAIKAARNGWTVVVIMAAVGLQICPFLLTIAFGCAPTVRAQLAYPMAIACDIVILFTYSANKKWVKPLLCLLAIIAIGLQTNRTTRMIYTDGIRAQEDARVVAEIKQQLDGSSIGDKAVAFVGTYQNHLNPSCIRGDLIGMSILNCNSEVLPHYCSSSARIKGLANVIGVNFPIATEEQILAARKQALNMPSWPAAGSIVDAGEYVIVKLSEDNWVEELIGDEIQHVTTEKTIRLVDDGTLRVAVDTLSVENNKLQVQGWAALNGVESTSITTGVYLYDEQTNEYYQLPTVRKQRPDLVAALENGYLYEYGGYYAKGDISLLQRNTVYKLYIGVQTDTELLMTDTGRTAP